jgi:hypothetical protein
MRIKVAKRLAATITAVVTVFGAAPFNVYALGDGVLYENKAVQQIAGGLKYEKSRRLYAAGWMDVYVLELDANSSDLALEVIQAVDGIGNKRTVPKLATDNGVIAAVNGDFFGSGTVKSSMGQVAGDGQMIAAQNYYNGSENRYAGLFIDSDGVPFIDYVKSSMGFYAGDSAAFVLGAKNKATDFSKPVYFDRNGITDTSSLDKTFSNLTKIVVEDGVITKISSPGETVTVPENGYLIVMNNATRTEKISWYSVGMSVRYDESEKFVFRPSKSISSIQFGISGGGELLRNGEIVSSGLIIGENARNPRTMVGINQDKSKVYIVCIDGRTNGIGATHAEAAKIMQEYGCYDAIHFDGGGSTTMVVQQENESSPSLVNVPSEGSLRAVANGIGIKATGESGVASWVKPYVEGSSDNYLFKSLENTINVNLYDGKLQEMSVDKNKLSFSSSLKGKWVDNTFIPEEEGSGTITVSYGDLTGSIDVLVLKGAAAIQATADSYAVAAGESTKLNAYLVNKDGYELSIGSDDVEWSVDDESVGTVSGGVFTGKSEGVATVTAKSHDVSTKLTIGVGKRYIAVNGFESYRNQKVTLSATDGSVKGSSNVVSGVGHEGSASLKVAYTFAGGKTTTQSVTSSFDNNKLILPDGATNLMLWCKGDGSTNRLKATFTDGSGKSADVILSDNLSFDSWTKLSCNIPSELSSPVTLASVSVEALNTDSGEISGEVYIDDVTVLAPAASGGSASTGLSDYMNAKLDSLTGDYELITAYGRTSGGNSSAISKVLTQMSSGASAMLFTGATSISNSTGVSSVVWNNSYQTNGTSNVSVMSLATGSGSLLKANSDQWRYMQDYVNNLSKTNVVVMLDKYIWGSSALSDDRERDAIHDILKSAVHESGKNIIVLSSVGESNYSEVKDGVRYINLAGVGGSSQQYLRIKADADNMYYEFANVN